MIEEAYASVLVGEGSIMAIRFFFEFDDQIVRLPVNPEEIVVKSPGNNKTEEIVKLGEIDILRAEKIASSFI